MKKEIATPTMMKPPMMPGMSTGVMPGGMTEENGDMPPSDWLDDCVESVAATGTADEPYAVCVSTWQKKDDEEYLRSLHPTVLKVLIKNGLLKSSKVMKMKKETVDELIRKAMEGYTEGGPANPIPPTSPAPSAPSAQPAPQAPVAPQAPAVAQATQGTQAAGVATTPQEAVRPPQTVMVDPREHVPGLREAVDFMRKYDLEGAQRAQLIGRQDWADQLDKIANTLAQLLADISTFERTFAPQAGKPDGALPAPVAPPVTGQGM